MPKSKTVSQTILPWLKANLGARCLAPLTGTDSRALLAATHIIELYSYHRQPEVIRAFGSVVESSMQPHTRELAYHAIAHIMDWSNRTPFWLEAGLILDFTPRKCAFEPGGSARSHIVGH